MQGNTMIWLEILGGVVVFLFLAGIRIVRPTRRGLIERLGKYHHFANPGFHWIIPVIDKLYQVNITEQLVNANPQEIITMNKIVKAENEKIAAIDFATAAETTADGVKRAAIKQAEGVRQARI
jgi:regulator of protease activity HflC (stomatin/prohibitin superfamily)